MKSYGTTLLMFGCVGIGKGGVRQCEWQLCTEFETSLGGKFENWNVPILKFETHKCQ